MNIELQGLTKRFPARGRKAKGGREAEGGCEAQDRVRRGAGRSNGGGELDGTQEGARLLEERS